MDTVDRRAFMRASAGALGGALVAGDTVGSRAEHADQNRTTAAPANGAHGPELHIGEARWQNGPLEDSVEDWKLFPQAYGVLASERLMHPIDVAHWPVQIGPERQLFVDNHLVARAVDVVRTVHQPIKERRNPIMVAEEPWELDKKVILLHVHRDPDSGRFRMWYTSWVRFMFPGTTIQGRMPTMYAESTDGLHWQRPKLGLLEYNGSKANNWVIYGRMYGLIHDPAAADPNRRYLATVMHERPYVRSEGVYLYGSPDGLRWSRLRESPILRLLKEDVSYPLDGLGDTSLIRYDSVLKLYVCDAKFAFRGPKFRTRGQTTSPDLVHWSRPRMTIHPDAADGADAQIYANVSFVYESLWLGMLRVYHDARAGYKQVDVQLTASRDGLHWSRVARRDVFLPLGGDESWERDYTDPAHSGPLLVNDELWFYYRGTRNRVTDLAPGSKAEPSDDQMAFATGLARLRRDGFVSIDGADKPGTLVTRPLTFAGRHLRVNANVAAGGEIRVGVVDPDGTPIPGLTADRCAPITSDSTSAPVAWAGNSDLRAAREEHEHLRLAFTLRRAELYSWWIE